MFGHFTILHFFNNQTLKKVLNCNKKALSVTQVSALRFSEKLSHRATVVFFTSHLIFNFLLPFEFLSHSHLFMKTMG
jgi:hypothetical protein